MPVLPWFDASQWGAIILVCALVAGFMQMVGYIIYIKTSDIEPEPLTWFMWGSTTWIIAIMEADSMIGDYGGAANVTYASWALLTLPVVCGIMAAIIAFRCWRHGKLSWPHEKVNVTALVLGMGLTALYIGAWFALRIGYVSVDLRDWMASALLVLLNLVTLIEFSPIFRNTLKHPEHERPLPWTVWTSAYLLLAFATIVESGWSLLLIYPILNATLHGSIAIASRRTRRLQMPKVTMPRQVVKPLPLVPRKAPLH